MRGRRTQILPVTATGSGVRVCCFGGVRTTDEREHFFTVSQGWSLSSSHESQMSVPAIRFRTLSANAAPSWVAASGVEGTPPPVLPYRATKQLNGRA